jgi:hypothetical protein
LEALAVKLVRYEAMCRAIEEAHSVDEVKTIRDQASALEHYARQAKNYEAERQCEQIRVRAERECGKRLKGTPKATGARGNPRGQGAKIVRSPQTTTQKTLEEYGLTKDQSAEWQQLADVPEEIFERELTTQDRPTAASIIHVHAPKVTPVLPVRKEALWLWGTLKDFEREGMLARVQSEVLATMTVGMLEDVRRLAPLVAAWLAAIEEGSDAQDERRPATSRSGR